MLTVFQAIEVFLTEIEYSLTPGAIFMRNKRSIDGCIKSPNALA